MGFAEFIEFVAEFPNFRLAFLSEFFNFLSDFLHLGFVFAVCRPERLDLYTEAILALQQCGVSLFQGCVLFLQLFDISGKLLCFLRMLVTGAGCISDFFAQ